MSPKNTPIKIQIFNRFVKNKYFNLKQGGLASAKKTLNLYKI